MHVFVISDHFDSGYFYRLHTGMPETDVATPRIPTQPSWDWRLALVAALLAGGLAGLRLRRET